MTNANGTDPSEAAADVAAQAQNAAATAKGPQVITLANGIRLRCRAVPPHIMAAIQERFILPEPPVIEIEGKGRSEPNPSDPNFLKAVSKCITDINETALSASMILGTEIDFLPEGVQPPEADGWLAELRAALPEDFALPAETPQQRYLSWLRFYAMTTSADQPLVQQTVARLSGLLDEDVERLVRSFRSRGGGRGDLEAPAAPAGDRANGNQLSRANRRSRARGGGA